VNFRRSVIIAELWRPKVARPWNFVSNFFSFCFGKKRSLMVKFSKFCSESFHSLADRRCCVEMSWNFFRREIMRYLSDQKNLAPFQTVATAQIAPKICQGQPPTFRSLCSRFHLNRFIFGGVIAERMKAVRSSKSVPHTTHCLHWLLPRPFLLSYYFFPYLFVSVPFH